MVKRRVLSEEISSDDDYCSAGSEPPLPSSSKRPSKKSTRPAKKRTKAAPDSDSEAVQVMMPHPTGIHSVPSPGPIRESLLKWYSGVHDTRGMPWRKPFDAALDSEGRGQRAYEVWISEIMLQQTQVATVIPYYNRWMEKFPTLHALASSDIEQVNALWKGLGYYSRAARLLAGAQKCVQSSSLSGRLPNNAKDMEALIPGIGRYSAGPICSIAYGERVPVLDGNVTRLMSRILALHAPIKAKATLNLLWTAAENMVELSDSSAENAARKDGDAGNVNQALIELGSTVCKVKDPLCGECPVQEWCGAYKLANSATSEEVADMEDLCKLCEPLSTPISVTAFPMKAEKKKAREEVDLVSVIEWRSQSGSEERWFILVRRPEGGLLAGLYEFPTSANVPADSASTDIQAAGAQALLADLLVTAPAPFEPKSKFFEPKTKAGDGLRVAKIRAAGDVLHVFSHIRKTYRVQWVLLEGGEDGPPTFAPNSTSVSPRAKAKRQKTEKARNDTKAAGKARWLPLKDVADANVGTGMMKVWERVKGVWRT